jgi:RimJ/RimL family protein N-acetyltransferase
MIEVYIRPLIESDACISYKWRNNNDLWEFTGARPDREITLEIELEWIKKAIKRQEEKRFAICTEDKDQYIGNVQLTHITNTKAQFHIFIGEMKFWNQGLGQKATKLLLDHGLNKMKLSEIYLYVNNQHKAAIKAYLNSGFEITGFKEKEKQVKMTVTKS